MSESRFANHVLASIRNELALLKDHDYLPQQAYNDILRLLPDSARSAPASNYGYPPSTMPSSPAAKATPPPVGSPQVQAPPPPYGSTVEFAEALYDFEGQSPDNLSFRRGEKVRVTERTNDDWWRGSVDGRTGSFPANYVQLISGAGTKQTPPPPPPPQRKPPPRTNDEYASYNYPTSYPPQSSQSSTYGAPPPQSTYGPPPVQQAYGPPPVQQSYGPPPVQQAYGPPPAQQEAPSSASGGDKASGMFKKVAGKVGEAATWGFGATAGSELAHSIF